MPTPWTTVAGTGHRALSDRADATWVADQLPRAAAWLRDVAGCRYAVSGLARGFDLDWAQAALDAGLLLCVAIPFEGQADRWNTTDRARWRKLRAAADGRERVIGKLPRNLPAPRRSVWVNRMLFARNTAMLEVAAAVLTVWEPDRLGGGTAGALLEAARRGLPGVHLDPTSRAVHFRLPTAAQLERLALVHTGCRHVAAVGPRAAVDPHLTALTAAGHHNWRIRPAKTRETRDDGCAVCLTELASTATAIP